MPVKEKATLVVLAVILGTLGCRRLVDLHEVGGARSPNEELVATLVEATPPGGALARSRYYVFLTKTGELKNWEFKESVWSSNDVRPAHLFWTGSRQLEVLVYPEGRDRFDQIFSGSKYGVTVTTRVIRDFSKEGVCATDPGEVIPTRVRSTRK